MSRLPTAVRKAVDTANKLHEEHYSEDPTKTPDPTTQVAAEPPKAPDPAPQPQAEPPKAPDPALQVAAEPPKAPDPAPQPQAVDWESKFKTLQGKYNAEVPRLSAEIRSLQEKISRLEQAPAPAAPPAQAPAAKTLVTKEEIEDHGEDFVDFVRRVAREEAAQATATVKPEIDKIKGQVATSAKQTASERVYASLDQNVPGWRETNTDPNFLEWLQEVDPFSGRRRSDLLMQAFEAGDATRVMSFFKGFATQTTLVTPQEPNPAPVKVNIETLAGPGRSPGDQPPKEPTKPKIYTRADIQRFYADVQRGEYRSRPEEKAKIEREIGRQLNQGLIQ